MSYADRLSYFGLQTLECRRHIADLVMCFQIVFNFVDLKFDEFFVLDHNINLRRFHDKCLYPSLARTDVKRFFFANRVIPFWNSLPYHIIHAKSVSLFRKLVSQHLS